MKKLLIFGQEKHREWLLKQLQQAGVVHIEPIKQNKILELPALQEEKNIVQNAIEIIEKYSIKENITPSNKTEATTISGTWFDLSCQIQQLKRELEVLENLEYEQSSQLENWHNWGIFSSTTILDLQQQGIKLRFWRCPVKDIDKFQAEIIPWKKLVKSEILLITISYEKDVIAPDSAREISLTKGPQEILQDREKTRDEIYKHKKSLQNYLGYKQFLQQHLISIQDAIALVQVRSGLLEHSDFFGVKGWIPATQEYYLQNHLNTLPVVIQLNDPTPEEQPPTLIQNPRWIQSILDVVLIYATPGYKEWDPSVSVYFSFAIFFAMIVGDAGYGLVILSIMLWFRKKMLTSDVGIRVYRLMVTISIATILYGAISGTWFALNLNKLPDEGIISYLKTSLQTLQFPLFKNATTETMMLLAIYVGICHLCVARIIQIVRLWPKTLILAEFGWILGMWSAMAIMHWQYAEAKYGFYAGLILVFLFSSTARNPVRRFFEGIFGLLGITQLFADVLSYLRLFALGLAGVVLGTIFNDMGFKLYEAFPGIVGYVSMIFVIFFGHTINIILAIMGGFIHGLRLNFLEFYRYCFEGIGYYYNPFKLQKKN